MNVWQPCVSSFFTSRLGAPIAAGCVQMLEICGQIALPEMQ
jgi:hypothetical protein